VKKVFWVLQLVDSAIEKISSAGLVLSVFMMLIFSILTIILRWFEITFLWFDPLVRHLVFLSAFLGGVIATGRGSHIGIDIIGKYLESKKKYFYLKQVRRIISFVSFGTVCWLIVASMEFFRVEQEYGKESFLGIHSSVLVAIIPFGFSLICYRFFYLFIKSFQQEEVL
jgi:TRAP-type C4-dicarboxylate transport system permease small subunit